jgi:hypothetical protein
MARRASKSRRTSKFRRTSKSRRRFGTSPDKDVCKNFHKYIQETINKYSGAKLTFEQKIQVVKEFYDTIFMCMRTGYDDVIEFKKI